MSALRAAIFTLIVATFSACTADSAAVPTLQSSQPSSPPAGGGPSASASGFLGVTRTAIDLGNEVHFNVIAARSHPLFGRFSFAKRGVGLFWASGASVVDNADGTVWVRYVGDGKFDPNAIVNVYLGLHQPSEAERSARLDLDITLESRDGSGVGRLIADGTTYELNAVTEPPPVDAAVATVLELTRRGDWTGLYGRLTPQFQAAMTREQFEAAMRGGFAGLGSIVEVKATAASTVTNQGAWFAASVPLTVTVERNGVRTTYPTRLVLVAVGNEWRVDRIDPIAPLQSAAPS